MPWLISAWAVLGLITCIFPAMRSAQLTRQEETRDAK